MISLFFLQAFILTSCTLTGLLLYNFNGAVNKEFARRPFIFYTITGIIFITVVVQISQLLFPVNLRYQLVFFTLLFLLIVFGFRNNYSTVIDYIKYLSRTTSPLLFAAFLLFWILVLLYNQGPTTMDDTESYHIQSIKWIKEYGSVPGLVNLHNRYGFNTSWFSFVAVFSTDINSNNFFTAANGFLTILSGFYILEKCFKKQGNAQIAYALLFILCMYYYPFFRGNITTANYDYITTLICFVLFTEVIFHGKPGCYKYELLFWPVFLFTVRIINFPLLIVSAFTLMSAFQRSFKKSVTIIGISALMILPFLIRNVILSGYLFYPSMALDFFNPDWKANKEDTLKLLRYIKFFNRTNTGFVPLEQTATLKGGQWIIPWFRYMFAYDKPIFLMGIAGILSATVTSISRRNNTSNYKLAILATMIVQIILWFLIAPDPRFIYGCLLLGTLILLQFLARPLTLKTRPRAVLFIQSTLIIFTVLFGITKARASGYEINWLLPRKLATPSVKIVTVDQIPMAIPEKMPGNWNTRCYGVGLPCLYELHEGLHLRTHKIKDGFKTLK